MEETDNFLIFSVAFSGKRHLVDTREDVLYNKNKKREQELKSVRYEMAPFYTEIKTL